MFRLLLLTLSLHAVYGAYNRDAAVTYAAKWWNTANHNCTSSYDKCSPWSYWGSETCGYPSHGGDCANFASQSILAGGHPALTKSPCRGYPCGQEEVGANNLGQCLHQNYGWVQTCGAAQKPPSNIQIGDVLVFHGSSCTDTEAHAVVVTLVNTSGVYITCHSSDRHNSLYTSITGFNYLQWLHYPS